jgi:hypothetical protein
VKPSGQSESLRTDGQYSVLNLLGKENHQTVADGLEMDFRLRQIYGEFASVAVLPTRVQIIDGRKAPISLVLSSKGVQVLFVPGTSRMIERQLHFESIETQEELPIETSSQMLELGHKPANTKSGLILFHPTEMIASYGAVRLSVSAYSCGAQRSSVDQSQGFGTYHIGGRATKKLVSKEEA